MGVGIRVEISGFRGRVRVGIEVEERRGRVESK